MTLRLVRSLPYHLWVHCPQEQEGGIHAASASAASRASEQFECLANCHPEAA